MGPWDRRFGAQHFSRARAWPRMGGDPCSHGRRVGPRGGRSVAEARGRAARSPETRSLANGHRRRALPQAPSAREVRPGGGAGRAPPSCIGDRRRAMAGLRAAYGATTPVSVCVPAHAHHAGVEVAGRHPRIGPRDPTPTPARLGRRFVDHVRSARRVSAFRPRSNGTGRWRLWLGAPDYRRLRRPAAVERATATRDRRTPPARPRWGVEDVGGTGPRWLRARRPTGRRQWRPRVASPGGSPNRGAFNALEGTGRGVARGRCTPRWDVGHAPRRTWGRSGAAFGPAPGRQPQFLAAMWTVLPLIIFAYVPVVIFSFGVRMAVLALVGGRGDGGSSRRGRALPGFPAFHPDIGPLGHQPDRRTARATVVGKPSSCQKHRPRLGGAGDRW